MIRSICELVSPEDVGISLPHEQILHNIGSIVSSSKTNRDLKIRFEDLIDYRRAPFAHGGRNLLLQNEDEAFRELEKLQQLKDNKQKPLIVDVTLPIDGRDVLVKERLHLAERLKDLNLVTVTTFELEKIDDDFCIGLSPTETSERIHKILETELMFGMERGGVVAFPGALYQQVHANSKALSPKELILVQGLALTQARTHCPLYLSITFDESCRKLHEEISGLDHVVRAWIRALLDAGAERKKLVVCHADRWCHGRFEETGYAFLLELFDLGVSVLFDMVGLLAVSEIMVINPNFTRTMLSSGKLLESETEEPASESRLVERIVKLLRHKPQYLFQMLLSTNVYQRTQYRCYGGGGYAYLFEHFTHRILREGVTATQWNQIVRTNVVDLLAWYVSPEEPPIPKNYQKCSICSNFFEPIEGEYFTKFAFIYCGTKCLRRHSRQKFASLPTKT
ncbi:hypothetical protein DD238_000779 [Peronospora effusa]|uniref:Vms1-associating treble clef domain-containing protein n=1 Tax=Peronospora effusa TaxID=542832 RepID=A0A3M6VL32_9STRA|nr:hypothetical protein DD238_000779 [Peronospora effusa]RQM17370.1 hypothetical protein DD237_001349 [Peronospora effusa]